MITVTTPPAGEPCSPADLKAYLRVTSDLEDDLLATLITAARTRLEQELGVAVLLTGLRETVAAPAAAVSLSVGPVMSVDAVALRGDGGAFIALDPAAWRVGDARPARVTLPRPGLARVDYHAGYATDPTTVPAGLKQAVLALAADAFERRDTPTSPAPPGLGPAERWAAPFRRARL